MDAKLRSSLTRYRVMAYVVGVMLLILVLVAMPLKYIGGNDGPVAVIGPIHGFLYATYLLTVLDLGTKSLWTFRRTVLIMLAGTIPFVSFVAERRVTERVHATLAA